MTFDEKKNDKRALWLSEHGREWYDVMERENGVEYIVVEGEEDFEEIELPEELQKYSMPF